VLAAPVHFNNVLFGGLLGSWFCLLQFTCAPLLGAASDRFGRRPCLLASYVGLALAYALWTLSGNSFALFLLSRTLGGICKANIGLATAIMADLLPLERRASGMALIGIAFAVGFTLGPLLGAGFVKYLASSTIGSYQHLIPARFALVLSTFNVIFVFFLFKESLPSAKRVSF
jgi:MFS family permease